MKIYIDSFFVDGTLFTLCTIHSQAVKHKITHTQDFQKGRSQNANAPLFLPPLPLVRCAKPSLRRLVVAFSPFFLFHHSSHPSSLGYMTTGLSSRHFRLTSRCRRMLSFCLVSNPLPPRVYILVHTFHTRSLIVYRYTELSGGLD